MNTTCGAKGDTSATKPKSGSHPERRGDKSASGQRGSVAMHVGLMMMVLVGAAGLGTEATYLVFKHRQMQMVADAAAVSAASALLQGGNPTAEARAVAAQLNFVNGANGAAVVVNNPPASGTYTANNTAVEVLIQQPQTMTLMGVFRSSIFPVNTRAVALESALGKICVLALSPTASEAIHLDNNAALTSTVCGAAANSQSQTAMHLDNNAHIDGPVSVVGNWDLDNNAELNGTPKLHNAAPIPDPYANVQITPPSTCTPQSGTCKNNCTRSFTQGWFCDGWSFSNNATINLNAGTYFIDNELIAKNNVTINATGGVTIIVNGNYSIDIGNNAIINIVAPSTGDYAGIAFVGLTGENQEFSNNAVLNINGGLYFPNSNIHFENNATIGVTTCTQIVANTIHFENNGSLDSSSCLTSRQMVVPHSQLVE